MAQFCRRRIVSLLLIFVVACYQLWISGASAQLSVLEGATDQKDSERDEDARDTNDACIIMEFMGAVGDFYGTEEFDRGLTDQVLHSFLADPNLRNGVAKVVWDNRLFLLSAITFGGIESSKVDDFHGRVDSRCGGSYRAEGEGGGQAIVDDDEQQLVRAQRIVNHRATQEKFLKQRDELETAGATRQAVETDSTFNSLQRDCSLEDVDAACFINEYAGIVGDLYGTSPFDRQLVQDIVDQFLNRGSTLETTARTLCNAAEALVPILTLNRVSKQTLDSFFDQSFKLCKM